MNSQESLKTFRLDGELAVRIEPLTPDASNRSYFRLYYPTKTAIACVYVEPFDESSLPFIDVSRLFEQSGIRVPRILSVDGSKGMVLQEDVGDTNLRSEIQKADAVRTRLLMCRATDLIVQIQKATPNAFSQNSVASRLSFDFEKLKWEMEFFKAHYINGYKADLFGLGPKGERELDSICEELASSALFLTHRDFHSANIMVSNGDELVVIDHQDARIGTAAYDLVSLLLDRMTDPPSREDLDKAIGYFLLERERAGLETLTMNEFKRQFSLQAVQRCLKAIGTFAFQTNINLRTEYRQYISPMLMTTRDRLEELGGFPSLLEFLDRSLASRGSAEL